jgi:hypothetical protein
MKQTAVEWLLDAIETKNGKEFSSYYSEFVEQAKKMEEEQTMKAYKNGYVVQRVSKQTFKTKEK